MLSAVGTIWRDVATTYRYVVVEHVTDERVYVQRVLSSPPASDSSSSADFPPAQRGRRHFTAPPHWSLSPVILECAYVADVGALESKRLRLHAEPPLLPRWPTANVLSTRLRRNLELSAFRPALALQRATSKLVLYIPHFVLALPQCATKWRLHEPPFVVLYEHVPRHAIEKLQKHVRRLYRDSHTVTFNRVVVLDDVDGKPRLVGILGNDALTTSLRSALPDYCSSSSQAYIEFSSERVGGQQHNGGSVATAAAESLVSEEAETVNIDWRNINIM